MFLETREQRCWFHVGTFPVPALPKSAHPSAKAALAQIYNAEDRGGGPRGGRQPWLRTRRRKWPKAVAKINDDLDELLAFYDYPASNT